MSDPLGLAGRTRDIPQRPPGPRFRYLPKKQKQSLRVVGRKRRRKGKKKQKAARVDYHSYINSKKWRRRVRRYYATHSNACAICGDKQSVQLHHKTYKRLGAELDEDLVPLCEDHHRAFHEAIGGSQGHMVKETDAFIEGERFALEAEALLASF